MINNFEELDSISQDLYCIVYRAVADGTSRLCYLQRNNKPLFFYSYKQAKTYFDLHELDSSSDSLFFWKKGNLNYPDVKIIKVTLADFEIASE